MAIKFKELAYKDAWKLRRMISSPDMGGGGGGGFTEEGVIIYAGTGRDLDASDAHNVIICTNTGSVALNIPTYASGLIPVDSTIYVLQGDTGQVTLTLAGGVTVEYTDSLKTRTQESLIGLKQIATDVWQVFGDTEPVAPAKSVLMRSANSIGRPDFVAPTAEKQVLQQLGGVLVFDDAPLPTPLDTTLTYNLDGTLDVVTTAAGTKTMGYSSGRLVSITGTGIYPSKTFSYTGDQLTGIDVT